MLVIFALSAQPDLSSGLGDIDLVGRKLAHMAEYGLLWWLWLRALDIVPDPRAAVIAALITLTYAATDEWHQTFVTGRHGSPVDWLIDAAGVVVAMLITRHLRRRKRPARPEAA